MKAEERARKQKEYEADPAHCEVCTGPIPYNRWRKGGILCGQNCGVTRLAKLNQTAIRNWRKWFCYVVRCADGSLYTGITTDLARRVQQHNTARSGAKYTRSRRPVSLVYAEQCASRTEAAVRECQIKKLNRSQKQEMVRNERQG